MDKHPGKEPYFLMNLTANTRTITRQKATLRKNFPTQLISVPIPLDFTHVPPHWHMEVELIVIKKGRGTVTVDFRQRSVTAGDIIFIRPGQLHSIGQEENRSMEYENIILKPGLLISGESDLCARQYLDPLLDGRIPSESFLTPALSYYKDASDCIRQIDLLCDTQPEGYQLGVKGFLFQFFLSARIQPTWRKRRNRQSRPKLWEKLKTILKYVEEHYAEHITIEDNGRADHTTAKSHFMKFFKAHMGERLY